MVLLLNVIMSRHMKTKSIFDLRYKALETETASSTVLSTLLRKVAVIKRLGIYKIVWVI